MMQEEVALFDDLLWDYQFRATLASSLQSCHGQNQPGLNGCLLLKKTQLFVTDK